MQILSFFKSSFSKVFFLILFFLISTNLHAARTITDITFISDANVTTGSTIHLEATIVLDKTGTSYQNYYRGLAYRIGNGVWRCANSVPEMTGVNYNVVAATPIMKTITSGFVIHADQPAGVYDITFRAAYDTSCNLNTPAAQSSDFTMPNAITISDGDPSFVLNFQHGMLSTTNKAEFDCDHLYAAADNVFRINSIPEGQPTTNKQGIDISEIYRPLADQRYTRSTTGQKTPSWNYSGRGAIMRTMALGPYGENGTMTAFHWHWDGVWAGNPGMTPAYIQNGTSSMIYMNPMPNPGYGWSGGEVNQMSGEVYFSGDEDRTFSGTYEFMVVDPVTGQYKRSGQVRPETPFDAVGISGTHVSSDMAIDAEGNFYVLVFETGRYYWLVRVVQGNSTGTWKYNKVRRVGPYTSSISQSLGGTTPGATTDVWGVAFLNGKLYSNMYMGTGNSALYEANPLTGETIYKGNLRLRTDGQERKYDGAGSANGLDAGSYGSSDTVLFDFKDLASCQVAPVLRGKVYYDADGNGLLSASEKGASGVANITIQLYDNAGKWIGEQETSGMGEYSFIVPINRPNVTTYYIRMKQPQINGANVPQTWADGGIYEYIGRMGGNNTATPTCYNGVSPIHNPITHGTYAGQNRYTYDTTCFGARSDGIDASTDSISAANYYTRIDFMTDRAVAYANFAVSGVDRSDSPARFGEVSQAVMHKSIYLGQGASVDNVSIFDDNANKDTLDDGVLVKDANNASENFASLQNYLFENKRTYTFRVFANSETYGEDGYLHGWMSLSNSSDSVVDNYNNGLKITDEAMVGNVSVGSRSGIKIPTSSSSFDFNYTIPDKVITTNTAGGNKSTAFFRFRYLPNNITGLSTSSPAKNSAEANTQPWATEGEVEDYKVTYRYSNRPPLIGNFTIVHQNNRLKPGDKLTNDDKALYTQIANKNFDVTLVYHNNDEIQPKFQKNIIIKTELIDASNLNSTNCGNSTHTNLTTSLIRFPSINTTETVYDQNNIIIADAAKEVAFRLKFHYEDSNETKTSCSDKFSVRPETYNAMLRETNGSAIVGQNIGGKPYMLQINATKSDSTATATTYNQTKADMSKNASLFIPTNCTIADDNVTDNVTITFANFIKGVSNSTITYNNVGNITVTIVDDKWTKVDQNLTNKAKAHCIMNSSSNTHDSAGKVGCNIEANITLSFYPKMFEGRLSIKNFNGGGFTYISNDGAMHAIANTDILALLYDNATATNYHENCYAFDVIWTLTLTKDPVDWVKPDNWVKPSNWAEDIDEITPQNSINFFVNNLDQASITQNNPQNGTGTGTATIQTAQNNFQNGTAANLPIGFNFLRQINAPQNPFTVNSGDFNIAQIQDINVVNAPLFNQDGSSAIFLFGRVTSAEYTGPSPHTATMRYEAFCDRNCQTGDYPALSTTTPRIESSWYITSHNNLLQGQVIDLKNSLGNTKIAIADDPSETIAGGLETRPRLTLQTTPTYHDDILINTQGWLLYDKDNPNANRNRFKVTFTGPGGGWAGDGQVSGDEKVGRVIPQNPSNRIKQAVDW